MIAQWRARATMFGYGQARRPPQRHPFETFKLAEAYLQQCVDELSEYVGTKKASGAASEWRARLIVKLPSVARRAVHIKCARSSIYEWAKQHREFSDMLVRLLAEQDGLSGEYMATIAKRARQARLSPSRVCRCRYRS